MAVAKKKLAPAVDQLGEIREKIAALVEEEKILKARVDAVFTGNTLSLISGNKFLGIRNESKRRGGLDEKKVAKGLGVLVEELAPWRKPDVDVVCIKTVRI